MTRLDDQHQHAATANEYELRHELFYTVHEI